MMTKSLSSHKYNITLVITVALLLGVLLTGCTATVPHGWSGVTISGNNLYVGSQNGKLVGMDLTNRAKLFNDLSLETSVSSGILGCGAGTATTVIYGTPVVAPDLGLVFIAGYNGKVYAVTSDRGVVRWVQSEPTQFIGGLALYGDKLYIGGNDGKLYALDAATGDPVWQEPFVTGNKIWVTPTVSGDTLFIGSFDKKLYAINLANGTEKWHFPTQGAIINTPIVKDGVVYFGSFDRYFYAVNAQNGTLIWKSVAPAGNWFWANPVLGNNVIFAPNIDGKIYIFNTADGKSVGSPINLGLAVASSPVLVDKKLIVATENGKSDSVLWAVDTSTYTAKIIIDLKRMVYAPLAANQNIVYLHTRDNMLYALNADTEAIIWSQSVITQ